MKVGLIADAPQSYLGVEYSPVQSNCEIPSGLRIPLHVPAALMPLNFPVALIAYHLWLAVSNCPSLIVAVPSYL
jgi:hypothetical protein